MERIADAARFVRRLGTVAHRGELWAQLKYIAAQFGFTDLTVFRVATNGGPMVSLVHNDAPSAVVRAFRDRYSHTDHPLVALALRQLEPFSAAQALGMHSTTVRQRQALASLGSALGLTDCWTFPVACSESIRGVVILAGRAPDMSPLICSTLHLLAHLAFRKSEEMEEAPLATDPGLTPREVECLRWVARGKTDAEIAVILSIRPRTARFHIENAKRKLGVAKRIHAVAEALRLRAIAA
jgi:LuxR family transcriptional regulator, quorum-sensing system regulator BjaR1